MAQGGMASSAPRGGSKHATFASEHAFAAFTASERHFEKASKSAQGDIVQQRALSAKSMFRQNPFGGSSSPIVSKSICVRRDAQSPTDSCDADAALADFGCSTLTGFMPPRAYLL